MGQRGPKPTPTKVLEMRGSWRAKKRDEPGVEMGKPTMPSYLSVTERQTWRKLTALLERAGLLAKLDGQMLGRYCVLYGQWLHARNFVHGHGQTYTVIDKEGNTNYKLYPEVRLILAFHKELAGIEAHFGMSPSARASLGALLAIGKGDGKDESKGRFFKTG